MKEQKDSASLRQHGHRNPAYYPSGKVTFFATRNSHKFHEARSIFAEFQIATAMLRVETVEIQDDDLRSIAEAVALEAMKKTGLHLIVEDTGLFINALNGFPGPYTSYVHQTIGTKGILKLMEEIENRDAFFRSVVAFSSPKANLRVFDGEVSGKISLQERGGFGFGFDPVFKPLHNDHDKTFAEMGTQEKNKISHRAKAFRQFAKWYTSTRRRF